MRIRTAILTLSVLLGTLSILSCSMVAKWQRAQREGDELALQNRLDAFRAGIRAYAADKKDLPQTLAELRNAGYGTILKDPITGSDDWQAVFGEDSNVLPGKKGIINVHSKSTAVSSRGTPYNTW